MIDYSRLKRIFMVLLYPVVLLFLHPIVNCNRVQVLAEIQETPVEFTRDSSRFCTVQVMGLRSNSGGKDVVARGHSH